MNRIDMIAYKSKIATIKTSHKVGFALFFLAVCLFVDSFILRAAVILIMSFSTLYFTKISAMAYLKLLVIPLAFVITGILTILVHQTPSKEGQLITFSFFHRLYGIQIDSILFCVLLFLKTTGAVVCLYFVSLNTPMNGFFYFLRKIRFPKLFLDILELMYRQIFVIGAEASQIYVAQSSRMGYEGFKNSVTSFSELLTSVFLRSFRRVERMGYALESRGFDGELGGLVEEEKSSALFVLYVITLSVALMCIGLCERMLL